MKTRNLAATCAAALLLTCAVAATADAQVRQNGDVTTMTQPFAASDSAASVDFAHARPLPLPNAQRIARMGRSTVNLSRVFGAAGGALGAVGDGVESPEQLVAPQPLPQGSGIVPQEFGTSGQPFTTSEVNAYNDFTTKYYPYRAAGKLFFNIGSSTYLCSASLIKPGILVTAAHCVADYGQSQFYSNWTYVPAYNNGTAPYGSWKAASATILTSYYNGTDNCAQYGVICPDDVAVLTMTPKGGHYPGTKTGWFGYGYNGYGFNSSSQALISQLGYPVDLDGGLLMQRNDSQGFVDPPFSNNTIIGSLMTGGSSGGPWLVNLGQAPTLSGGDAFGTYAAHEVVVGVTSWGYTDLAVKQQGAAPFTSGNIAVLINVVCGRTPGAC